MAKRKKPAKRKRKPIMLGEGIMWNGNAYVVTTFETVQNATSERLQLTAVRYLPISTRT
jgi:hypothetical protein